MNCFLISDNSDTRMGMRLAGIEGVVVHKREEALEALKKAVKQEDLAVIFVTGKLAELCGEEINEMKLNLRKPLITVIPDRHGGSHIAETLSGYVSDAVGIKI